MSIKNIVFDVGGELLVNATKEDVEKKLTFKESVFCFYIKVLILFAKK